MSGFLVTNKDVNDLSYINHFLKLRGPDNTNIIKINGFNFISNLLKVTGKEKNQPFIDGNIVCVYDGVIYNYKDYDKNVTDGGEILISLYKEFGVDFIKKLDGEFSICLLDFDKNICVFSPDTFLTKPIFFSKDIEGFYGVSSLKSGLTRLGFHHVRSCIPNTFIVFDFKNNNIIKTEDICSFDIEHEYKDSFDDWIVAFENSVKKRMQDLRENSVKSMLLLSDGYDSGAICCEALKQKFDFNVLTIKNQNLPEYTNVIKWRLGMECDKPLPIIDRNLPISNDNIPHIPNIPVDKIEYFEPTSKMLIDAELASIDTYETFKYYWLKYKNLKFGRGSLHNNIGRLFGFLILDRYKIENFKVIIGGWGGDFITANCINKCRKYRGNIYPRYDTVETSIIIGTHGMQDRNPFLDNKLYQESCWLDKKIYVNENRNNKAMLHYYLSKNKFPFFDRDENGNVIYLSTGLKNYMHEGIKSVKRVEFINKNPEPTLD